MVFMNLWLLCNFGLTCFSQISNEISSPASVQGIVLDPKGHPVLGALVSAVRLTPTRWTSLRIQTKSDGVFEIKGLDAGAYAICADVPRTLTLVDPCIWLGEAGKKRLDLGAGQQSKGNVVQLLLGRILQVEVKDPLKTLSSLPSKSAASAQNRVLNDLQVVVQGPPNSIPRRLRAARPSPDGMVYETILPIGTSVKLHVRGLGVNVADSASRALANNFQSIPLTVPDAKQSFKFTYNLTPSSATAVAIK